MNFKPLNLRSPALQDLGLGALAFIVLLLSLMLSEVRHARLQVLAELRLLSQAARSQLDRPSLLDAAHFARLTALGQGTELLGRRVAGQWLIGAGGVDSKTLDQAAQRLQSLASQRKPFADLAQTMEQLARETVAGDRALPGSQALCGEDVSVVDMPRLRGILGDRLTRANAGESGKALGLGRAESAQHLQEAIALVDQFLGLRRDTQALLNEAAAPATSGASDASINGLALLAVLLALAAAARRWLGLAAPAASPAGAPSRPLREEAAGVADPQPAAVLTPDKALPDPYVELQRPAQTWPTAASGVLIDEESWQDLQLAVNTACDAGASLERLARALIEGTGSSSQQAEGELVIDLLALMGLLQRAREGTINLALSRLGEQASEADTLQVESLERLDGLLATTIAALAKLDDLRDQRENLAEPRSVVPRRELVRLQSEMQHLCSQLDSLQHDVVVAAEPGSRGAASA